ncbi:feruloyl-CoA synthase [Pannonibacter phragmitetus]|uniref:feruloyl-CoA synthase n=1 Tax=Pannonibacter phragmitetus TaxID=121719 RepID=UPI001FFD88DD|nr:feruloyl-CoA synthase [Pannonibacter phragmitetus]
MTAGAMARKEFWTPELAWETRADGSIVIWREDALGAYASKINERLVHWAKAAPDRTWMAAREGDGWKRISYAQALAQVRSLAQAFLDHGLSVDRPVAILAENSLEHALMALSAQHVGIPSAAISANYVTLATDFGKLTEIAQQITPGLAFVEDGMRFRAAVDAAFGTECVLVAARNLPADRPNSFLFEDLLKTEATAAVDAAFDAVGPDTVAKFLFTSGTTGSPKAVIQTQRMLCSNQEMIRDCYQFLKDEPPVIIDWAPWNHVAAGSKIFNMALYNGGTFYIDNGRPSPQHIGETIRNLKDISPTWYFNVPAGYEMLVHAFEADPELARNFFKNLKLMMYAGAGMAQHTWDSLREISQGILGHSVLLSTGLGATETSPFSLFCTTQEDKAGNVGIPAQGITMKLIPVEDKYELRLKGPNVTPGYWRNPELTAAAFDEEGFYRIGDALKFAEEGDPTRGFFFDGRIAENFKLQTGTWVAVGPLRAQLVDQFAGLIRDAVITGENEAELGALVLLSLPAARKLIEGGEALDEVAVQAHPAVQAALAARLYRHQKQATGSASRVMRLAVLMDPPRLDKGEITEKGSLNQRALRSHRHEQIAALYDGGADVILAREEAAA